MLTNPFAKALFWTFVHSLWIGLIAAALAALLILFTRRTRAALRYNVLCGLLAGFLVAVGIVFIRQFDAPAAAAPLQAPGAVMAALSPVTTVTPSRIMQALDASAPWLLICWWVCFLFRSVRLTREYFHIRRLRRERVADPGAFWADRVTLFARRLGIDRPVRLLESALVRSPLTVGYLRPLVLLPIGLLAGLPVAQIDAILWHELAHIRRRDYLAGMLQSFVDAVFFFNPAIRWVSRLIREERENCCDDVVLTRVPAKRDYLEALMAFQGAPGGKFGPTGISAWAGESTHVQLASGLQGTPLMNRLRRIVQRENARLSAGEKIALVAGIFLFSAFSLFHPIHFTQILFNKTNADPANREIWAADDLGNHYHLRVAGGHLVESTLNGAAVDGAPVLAEIDSALARKRHRLSGEDIAMAKSGGSAAKTGSGAAYAKTSSGFSKAASPGAAGKGASAGAFDKSASPGAVAKAAPAGKHSAPYDISGDRARVHLVIDELVKSGVVAKPSAVDWFGLSVTELIVNGVKQPDALRERLVKDAGVFKDYGLYYGPVQMTGTGVFLDKRDL